MTSKRREQHLHDVMMAIVEYAGNGAAISFHSDRSDGVLSITFRLEDPAAYDETLEQHIADSNNGVHTAAR